MSRKTVIDNAMPVGEVKRVADMLPPPSELVLREENVKVTLSLSTQSIEFFKEEAKKLNVPYQRMIRNLVDQYVSQHAKH